MSHWPLHFHTNQLTLRPLRYRDYKRWLKVREENKEWLSPWEATMPHVPGQSQEKRYPSFFGMVRALRRDAREGRGYSLMIWSENNLIGQITMAGIILGAMRGAHIGYWIDRFYAGRGYVTEAVKVMTAFGFEELGLHRIEISMRPENAASIRVAEKAGFSFEGERKRYIHIDGAWRDHLTYVKENPLIQ